MPWGYARKRSRNIEMCKECQETEIDTEIRFDGDDWGVCGGCQSTMGEDCMQQIICHVCEPLYKTGDYDSFVAESMACCSDCMVSCCNDCVRTFIATSAALLSISRTAPRNPGHSKKSWQQMKAFKLWGPSYETPSFN
jgi:hypothetical protein